MGLGMSGLAMRMRSELAELARKHRVADPVPVIIPPVSPPPGDVIVEGLAVTRNLPLDRIALRPWALRILPWQEDNPPNVRLLYKHDASRVAGKVLRLAYDARGQLEVRAQVSDPFAKACNAFSISARIDRYELRDVDKQSFHAMVLEGEVDEVSLVTHPADPTALVLRRLQPAPMVTNYATLTEQVARLKEMVKALPPELLTTSAPRREPAAKPPRQEMTADDVRRLRRIHERAALRAHAAYYQPKHDGGRVERSIHGGMKCAT
jgi:hypothetical protein